MKHTVIINGRSYELPKKTMRIAERIEDVVRKDPMNNIPLRQKYENTHACIEEILGTENTKEIFGSDNLDEVDLCEVTLTFKKIVDAYTQPLKEYDSAKMRNSISGIPFEKITSLADVMNQMAKDGKS